MHHSLKTKIMILLAAMVTGLVLLILAINSTFITRFYSNEKKRDIVHAYNEVGEILAKYENCEIDASEMSNRIEKVTNPVGVSLFIVDSGWNTIYSSKNQGGVDDRDRMVDSIFAKPSEKIDIIEKKRIIPCRRHMTRRWETIILKYGEAMPDVIRRTILRCSECLYRA